MTILKALSMFTAAATIYGGMTSTSAQQPAAQVSGDQVTVTFSDPSRPGTLRVGMVLGSITIRGENRKDVAIEAARSEGRLGRSGRGNPSVPDDASRQGLRRLTQDVGFTIEEENNTMSINAGPSRRPGRSGFVIQVPNRTNLKLSSVQGGAITVENVEGELEVNNTGGPIKLTNVAGSVVAHSVNGSVAATLTRVTAQKAMAFTSMNGSVDVTMPASTKANLKLRSEQGDVFTDFDIQLRPASAPSVADTRRSGGRFRLEVNREIYGSINGGGPEIELRSFNGSVFVRKGN